MTKLSLSHALAQSTKISFFEGVIDNTIDATKVRFAPPPLSPSSPPWGRYAVGARLSLRVQS
jgi:hypothetical protein